MTTQKLTHWTDKEYKKILLKGIIKQSRHFMKPSGIWISVNGSWEKWLDGNWEGWLKGKVCLNVELKKDINLFIINSKQQFLNKFKELTGKDYSTDSYISCCIFIKMFHEKIKKLYDGMWLKAKPFYAHRLDFDYFYSWDCESICIWNTNKIKFKEMKK